VAVRYDAAIIGAGADGLAAAAALGRAGASVIVLERSEVCGGRATTREFHPGFRASPFADELAPIPAEIFHALDLARHGAIFMRAPASLALWPDRSSLFLPWAESHAQPMRLAAEGRARAAAALAHAMADTVAPRRGRFAGKNEPAPWPSQDWTTRSLVDLLRERVADANQCAHLLAQALAGRAADPFLAGSALHLLAAGGGGMVMGGLATLGAALEAAAREAGADISLGLEVTDIRRAKDRVSGVCLADGTEIQARAVISTLDVKRTFLSLFAWKDLPQAAVRRAANFRMAAGTARLLLALDAPLAIPGAPEASRGPIHIAPDVGAESYAAWRAGTIPEHPPISVRLVSASDPRLAPIGKATMTATMGCIPHTLFDGAWTNEKRGQLRERVLARIEEVLPGLAARVLAAHLIVPPDIEAELGLGEGDLDGGEIAPDQMLRFRPFAECAGGRTPFAGLYLAGPSSAAGPLATCAAGVIAARALLADLRGMA
jgi:phytoene dehydrogenase-like protein